MVLVIPLEVVRSASGWRWSVSWLW